MKAITRRSDSGTFTQQVEIRQHKVPVDDPTDHGGDDTAPSPQELLAASLASCTAVTMEMYAKRKGWDVEGVEVDCEYEPASKGQTTAFTLVLRFPSELAPEQIERLSQIAAKCPVHRTLEGEVSFEQRTELAESKVP